MEEKVIKPHLVKPMLEKIVYDKLQNPQNGVMVNIKPEDYIDVKKNHRGSCQSNYHEKLIGKPCKFVKTFCYNERRYTC